MSENNTPKEEAELKQSRIWFEDWWRKRGGSNQFEMSDAERDIKQVAWEAWKAGRDEL